MIHKFIYKIGIRLRSPEIPKKYTFLKESENWSLEELEAYQFKQLKRIVDIAYNKSIFYRNSFNNVGLKPDDIKSLDDIKKIPTTSKSDLLENKLAIQNKNGYRKLFFLKHQGVQVNHWYSIGIANGMLDTVPHNSEDIRGSMLCHGI